jgi:hypothetical protein
MVKIRYLDLPAGLHVSAERRGRTTIIYLLPGLTAEQRRAAIVRARSSGRMGLGPELPPVALALALGVDWLRTTVRNGLAATRSHPVVLLPALILAVSSAIVFMVVSLVSVVPSQSGPPISYLFGARPHPSQVKPGNSANTGRDPAGPRSRRSGPAVPSPIATFPVSVMPPSGSSSPIPVLSPAPSPSPSSSPSAPSTSPSPSPASSPSPAATCVKLGPLGLCVSP